MRSLWFIVLFIKYFFNEKTATIKTNSLILNKEIKLLLTKVALLDHNRRVRIEAVQNDHLMTSKYRESDSNA